MWRGGDSAQADALELEAMAKRRLADEYDAAQARGEVAKNGQPSSSMREELPTITDIGLTHKDIHDARIIRDAEVDDPGIVRDADFGKGDVLVQWVRNKPIANVLVAAVPARTQQPRIPLRRHHFTQPAFGPDADFGGRPGCPLPRPAGFVF